MGKLLKRRSEMISGEKVVDNLDSLEHMSEKYKNLTSDTRSLDYVREANKRYYDSLSREDKDDYIKTYNMTKTMGMKLFNRDMRQAGAMRGPVLANYGIGEFKDRLSNMVVNGERLVINDGAMEELELGIRDQKINFYQKALSSKFESVKKDIDQYSDESFGRNMSDGLHNLKENAVVGLVNNHPFMKLQEKMGLTEKIEPNVVSSISDKELLSRFESIHVDTFGISSADKESIMVDENHLELGD